MMASVTKLVVCSTHYNYCFMTVISEHDLNWLDQIASANTAFLCKSLCKNYSVQRKCMYYHIGGGVFYVVLLNIYGMFYF